VLPVARPPGYELYLYQFGKSIPASDAKEIDFNTSISNMEPTTGEKL
jgi:hypothetical protein